MNTTSPASITRRRSIGSPTMISGSISGYATTNIGGSDPMVLAIVIGGMGAVVFALAVLAAVLRQKQHESR